MTLDVYHGRKTTIQHYFILIFWNYRRNEQIIGVRAFLTKQPGGTMTVTGDDPKKFAAAMVEYSKEKVSILWAIVIPQTSLDSCKNKPLV